MITEVYSVIFLLLPIMTWPTLSVSQGGQNKLKILLLSDPLMSHMVPLLAIGEELASRGHNVTLLTPLFEDQQAKMKAEIEKHGVTLWNVSTESLPHLNKIIETDKISQNFVTATIEMFKSVGKMMEILARHLNGSLEAGDWDIVLGSYFSQSLSVCMQNIHKVPFVFVGFNLEAAPHSYPSWTWPGLLSGASSNDLTFVNRVSNLFYTSVFFVYTRIIFYISMSSLSEYCPSVSLTHTLSAAGTHFPTSMPTVMGFEYPRDTSSLTDYVGALVPKTTAPLTQELEEWLGSKPERSVIYISMGSLYSLNKDHGKALFEGVMEANKSLLWALRKSNQWILEDFDLDPEKVLISDWTPQFSVLGSAAIHSAILHGGFNGLSEAFSNGVPVIVFPQMLEQVCNAGRVHFNKLGMLLEYNSISSSKVTESVRALDMGEYRSNLVRMQKAFYIAGGARRAGDLVEFYATVGYSHLVPACAKYQCSWIVYYNVDVYATLLLSVLAVSLVGVRCCRCCWRRCTTSCGSKIKKD